MRNTAFNNYSAFNVQLTTEDFLNELRDAVHEDYPDADVTEEQADDLADAVYEDFWEYLYDRVHQFVDDNSDLWEGDR